MGFLRLIIAVVIAMFLLIAMSPGVAYLLGLAKVEGRPTPADSSDYEQAAIEAAWKRCREDAPVSVEPMNPWGFASRFMSDDSRGSRPGERAAWQVARKHNALHPVGSMSWWHLSGAALTIWITRNWSAEQIAATLVRDGLCD